MNYTSVLMLCLFVCVASSFHLTQRFQRRRENDYKQTTCKLNDMTRPNAKWAYASNMTCDVDVARVNGKNVVDAVAIGVACRFTYSCPLDRDGAQRNAIMKCNDKGSWDGRMPDCSSDDQMVEDILQAFGPTPSPRVRDEEEGSKEEKEEEKSSVFTSGVRKSAKRKKHSLEKLKKLCMGYRMCAIKGVYRVEHCNRIVLKSSRRTSRYFPRFQEMYRGLCRFCLRYVCNVGIDIM